MLIVGVGMYLPYRGASLAARYELIFEIIAVATILVIVVASYATYGWRVDWEQWDLGHLGTSATFIAAVSAVGSYAGFESVASLGAEAKDAHRTIARSLLRVVILLGVLYIIATYPQVLFFDGINGDEAVLPQLADATSVSWINHVMSGAVADRFHRVRHRGHHRCGPLAVHLRPRGRATQGVRESASRSTGTPWVGIVFIGVLAFVVRGGGHRQLGGPAWSSRSTGGYVGHLGLPDRATCSW